MDMISAKERERIINQMKRDESKIVNIVLNDANQVAGEIEKANHQGIFLVDGRYYGYEDIKEINGS
ncbi:hypothetical protein [Brevibacillus brevis]|uniref:Uncharacterized protein n=1 Tax=Brevibacillus brevis TaxID=1393 RepID=A0A517I4G7_BREBE|nr:hypothetical protein [Brevibacillus brevis]QDS33795.1 hypothetical protein FPS98_07200 [Brevibacillus brevis]